MSVQSSANAPAADNKKTAPTATAKPRLNNLSSPTQCNLGSATVSAGPAQAWLLRVVRTFESPYFLPRVSCRASLGGKNLGPRLRGDEPIVGVANPRPSSARR